MTTILKRLCGIVVRTGRGDATMLRACREKQERIM